MSKAITLLKYIIALAIFALLSTGSFTAQASYPEKPITLVVGFSAGGGTDTYARTLGGLIHESLDMPMVIVNKPGAAGMIAAKFVKDRPADGYTLYMASAGSLLVKYLYDTEKSPVNPNQDFRILGMIGASVPGLFVPAGSRFNSAADLVTYAKANPGKLRWSHPGRGSLFQLTGEAFLTANRIKTQDIPFKGGSKARNAVAGQQVDFGFMGVQLGNGFESKMQAIAVAGEERDSVNPEIETFAEQGLPLVSLTNPQMIMAPAGMSDAAANTVTAAIAATVNSESYQKILKKAGLSSHYKAPNEAQALLSKLQKQLQPVIDSTR